MTPLQPNVCKTLTQEQLPKHVAVIMDGNGRWAQKRGLPRVEGHREGMNSVRSIITQSARLGISHLTLYAFSTENWRRPKREVNFLMNLLIEYLKKELAELHRQEVRIRMIGSRERISSRVLKNIDYATELTRRNQGLNVHLAFNYGSRQEILEAVEAYIQKRPRPVLTEQLFSELLYTANTPDPDLLIRTSGEMRLSNFLLWQLAYAEIIVTPVFWPDFRENQFQDALTEFASRERRYGGIGEKK